MKMTKRVNIDVCTFCNHKCFFCSNSDDRTVKEIMNHEDFDVIVSNIIEHIDISELGLSAKGEVLINKDLAQIIHCAKAKYQIPYVYLSTNGSLLNKVKAKELFENGLDSIKFSINAIDQEDYKEVHKVDDFEKVIQNFKDVLELKKTTFPNLKVFISSITKHSRQKIVEEFNKIFDENFELIDGISYYEITYSPKFEMENLKENQQPTKKCPLPFTDIYINTDGTLGLCCKDFFNEFNFGSLLEQNFDELYNCKEFSEIRKMHETNKFPNDHFCKKCLMYGD